MSNEKKGNKPGFGVLFRNTNKTGQQPDYTGTFSDPDGTSYKIAGWVRKSKNELSYMSLKVEKVTGSNTAGATGPKAGQTDDLPF